MPAKRGVGADRRLSLPKKPVLKPDLVRSRSYTPTHLRPAAQWRVRTRTGGRLSRPSARTAGAVCRTWHSVRTRWAARRRHLRASSTPGSRLVVWSGLLLCTSLREGLISLRPTFQCWIALIHQDCERTAALVRQLVTSFLRCRTDSSPGHERSSAL